MNDKELLELAAKAEGVVAVDGHYWIARDSSGEPHEWNPLTDDGDALRLAVKLGLAINITPSKIYASGGRIDGVNEVMDTSDPYAATRRAIVRAAAEIGKWKGE